MRSKTNRQDRTLLVLSDSVSVGIGVNVEEAYSYLLENKLPAERVLNGSVTGYGISDYVAALHETISEVKPEKVLIGFCLNDTSISSQANILGMIQRRKEATESIPDEKTISKSDSPVVTIH